MNDLQTIANEVFGTDWSFYPVGTLMPVVHKYSDGSYIVSILNICESSVAVKFKEEGLKVAIDTEISDKGTLIIRYHFPFHVFTMEVFPKYQETKVFIEALKTVDNICMWVFNDKYEVQSVRELGWNYKDYSDVLDKLIA